VTPSFARQILIHKGSGRAYGVEYIKEGVRHVVFATKEVVVSAGAVNSPQLLMLSGIGPREELLKHQVLGLGY